METKSNRVRRLVASGNYNQALLICKDWIRTDPAHREILRLGYECRLYPEFYKQIGKDPDKEYQNAVDLLIRLYT